MNESIVIIRDPIPGQKRTITVTFLTTAQAAQLPAIPDDAPQAILEIEAVTDHWPLTTGH